ncbi:hypothetical protein [Undibacterium sp. Tian12W]|uniref:hypothetical protein n=1 Tax=Undibacterium sp. Tian12W TaxID=3413054 RepID=UPI003BF3CE9C
MQAYFLYWRGPQGKIAAKNLPTQSEMPQLNLQNPLLLPCKLAGLLICSSSYAAALEFCDADDARGLAKWGQPQMVIEKIKDETLWVYSDQVLTFKNHRLIKRVNSKGQELITAPCQENSVADRSPASASASTFARAPVTAPVPLPLPAPKAVIVSAPASVPETKLQQQTDKEWEADRILYKRAVEIFVNTRTDELVAAIKIVHEVIDTGYSQKSIYQQAIDLYEKKQQDYHKLSAMKATGGYVDVKLKDFIAAWDDALILTAPKSLRSLNGNALHFAMATVKKEAKLVLSEVK